MNTVLGRVNLSISVSTGMNMYEAIHVANLDMMKYKVPAYWSKFPLCIESANIMSNDSSVFG